MRKINWDWTPPRWAQYLMVVVVVFQVWMFLGVIG